MNLVAKIGAYKNWCAQVDEEQASFELILSSTEITRFSGFDNYVWTWTIISPYTVQDSGIYIFNCKESEDRELSSKVYHIDIDFYNPCFSSTTADMKDITVKDGLVEGSLPS